MFLIKKQIPPRLSAQSGFETMFLFKAVLRPPSKALRGGFGGAFSRLGGFGGGCQLEFSKKFRSSTLSAQVASKTALGVGFGTQDDPKTPRRPQDVLKTPQDTPKLPPRSPVRRPRLPPRRQELANAENPAGNKAKNKALPTTTKNVRRNGAVLLNFL